MSIQPIMPVGRPLESGTLQGSPAAAGDEALIQRVQQIVAQQMAQPMPMPQEEPPAPALMHREEDGLLYEGDRPFTGRTVLSIGRERYEGEFVAGRREGFGVSTDFRGVDGLKYTGQWRNGNPHGRGEQSFKGLLMYDGEWQHGQRHGQGIGAQREEQGRSCVLHEGRWRNNAPVQSSCAVM